MKKFIYGMSAKAIAAAVCVISFLGMAVCIAAVSVQLPSEAEARDQGYGQIIKNYSAYLLDHMEEPEELDDFLSKSNMEAAILKGKQADLDRVIAEASSADLVYGDPELISGHSYTFSSFQGAGYAYNMDSLSEVLDQEKFVYYKSSDYEEIIRYVFSTQTGLFYYNTRSGYYPVSDVKLISWIWNLWSTGAAPTNRRAWISGNGEASGWTGNTMLFMILSGERMTVNFMYVP